MNKNFDLHRLGMVVRWSILSEWKHFASGIIGLSIGIALFCILTLFFNLSMTIETGGIEGIQIAKELYLSRVYGFMGANAFIAFYVLASCIFTNMKGKLKRENFLMLPASNLEKFAARLALTTIGAVIGIFCALVIGDIIQLIFSLFITPDFHVSITWPVVTNLGSSMFPSAGDELPAAALYAFLLFAHSFATLGGTLYRKLPTLLTLCTSILLCIILGIVIGKLEAAGLLNFNIHIDFSRGTFAEKCIEITAILFFLALSALNYWGAYKIFCRMQVISNKWINL